MVIEIGRKFAKQYDKAPLEVQLAFKDRLLRKGFTDIEIPERHFEIGLT